MTVTPLHDRCHRCGNISQIAKSESAILYGKPFDRLYCAPCAGIKPPKPKAMSYLTLKQITALKTTAQGMVLDAIGQSVLTKQDIDAAIVDRYDGYLQPERLSEALRILVRGGVLVESSRIDHEKTYQVCQKKGNRFDSGIA